MYVYGKNVIEAINRHPEKFNKMMALICGSPFQSEHGDLWVNKRFAEAVCRELYEMAMDKRMTNYHDFEELAHREDDELLTVVC